MDNPAPLCGWRGSIVNLLCKSIMQLNKDHFNSKWPYKESAYFNYRRVLILGLIKGELWFLTLNYP